MFCIIKILWTTVFTLLNQYSHFVLFINRFKNNFNSSRRFFLCWINLYKCASFIVLKVKRVTKKMASWRRIGLLQVIISLLISCHLSIVNNTQKIIRVKIILKNLINRQSYSCFHVCQLLISMNIQWKKACLLSLTPASCHFKYSKQVLKSIPDAACERTENTALPRFLFPALWVPQQCQRFHLCMRGHMWWKG